MTQESFDAHMRGLANPSSAKLELGKLGAYLEASERLMIGLMQANGIRVSPPAQPVVEEPVAEEQGALEFGFVPYWIHNPPAELPSLVRNMFDVLALLVPTRIATPEYDAFVKLAEASGVVAEDGTICGFKKYEEFDLGWLWDLPAAYAVSKGSKAVFRMQKGAPIDLSPIDPSASEVKIAIVSDWGSGEYWAQPSNAVMKQIVSMSPDYIVHLGDVYYLGSASDSLFLPGLESKNFLEYWPTASQLPIGRSFALNSNHEMYSGGFGYFGDALADPRFAAQGGASYFAMRYAGWTILGLDTAYNCSDFLYMNGRIDDADPVQGPWIAQIKPDPQSTIVLSHHNAMDYAGTETNALWEELVADLGAPPFAWYWGHVHNGIVYNGSVVESLTRCVGHGSLPFGDAWGLKDAPGVSFYTNTPVPGSAPLVENGWLMLTIGAGRMSEALYQPSQTDPVWSNAASIPTA